MKILMVCLGNICRSPLAEGIMRHKIEQAGLNWTIDSAGTSHYQTGDPPHKLSQKVALMNGIDICEQCCRQFEEHDLVEFDKVYVMDRENYREVRRISKNNWDPTKVDYLLNELYPGENKQVPDPYYGEEKHYHEVFEMIDKACDQIVNKYNK